jgi:hypothetical protein
MEDDDLIPYNTLLWLACWNIGAVVRPVLDSSGPAWKSNLHLEPRSSTEYLCMCQPASAVDAGTGP